jgi:hypothetical protein
MVIYGKKTSKIENKTRPSLCLPTWLQQNLRISTNHNYGIYMDVFLWVYRFFIRNLSPNMPKKDQRMGRGRLTKISALGEIAS